MRERLPEALRPVYDLIDVTLAEGGQHDLSLFAPAMAYALVVSLAPLTIALNAFGTQMTSVDPILPGSPLQGGEISAERLFGGAVTWAGPLASVAALLLVVWGASALFGQLVNALGRIWRQGKPIGGTRAFVRSHLFAMLLVVVVAIGLFISALAGNALAALARVLADIGGRTGVDLGWLSTLLRGRFLLDFVFAAVLLTTAFATVPRLRPRIRDVAPGALLTAAAYALGQAVLGGYLGSSARLDALGAFGAFLAFLIWAYYTALIILWGAELTYQIARRRALRRGGPDAEGYRELAVPGPEHAGGQGARITSV